MSRAEVTLDRHKEVADSTSADTASVLLQDAEVFAVPLSLAQERMIDADRRYPSNPAYNASFRLRLEGRLDHRIFQRVVNEIIRRHETLRTAFDTSEGKPVQLIYPALEIPILVEDLRDLPLPDRQAEMESRCEEEAREPFDLSKSPLMRVRLLRMADDDYVLTLTFHHIVCDGWSLGILLKEIESLYQTYAGGKPSRLAEPSIQYADYVVWQREWLETADNTEQITYWRRKLRGYRPLEISPDNPRVAATSFPGEILSVALPASLTDGLRALSGRLGGTMFTTTLAAFKALLARYTGRSDIGVGSHLAGRDRSEIEDVVGLFVSPVVLRTDLSGDPSLSELLERVRNTVFDAFANRDLPYEKLLEALHPGGDPYAEPLYRVNFICQREYARADQFVQEFAGIRMRSMPSKCQGALYDMQFFMVERADGWRLSCEYNTDLYKPETPRRMLGHFQEVLEAFAADPSVRISTLPLSGELPRPPLDTAAPADSVCQMPASLTQRRFWLLEQFRTDKVLLHMPACVRVLGPLDTEVLRRSLEDLVGRYEILRTTFVFEEERLYQRIGSGGEIPLSVISMTHLPDLEREAETLRRLREEARRPFDLSQGPLARATLYELGPDDHVLLLNLHHIISDGWSQGLLQRQLWQIYEAFAAGEASPLRELKLQYADYAQWQEDWLRTDAAHQGLEFWKDRLKSPLPILDLPAARNESASGAGSLTVTVPAELAQSLRSFVKRENVTAFTLLLGCFKALLFHYSGQPDILVGSPVANRTEETEGLVGPFSTPVALRSSLAGDPTFRELISRVMEVTMDAFAHNEVPFERILDEIDVQARAGRNPIFQFYFYYQSAFLQAQEISGLKIKPLPTISQGTNSEIQMAVIERPDSLSATFEYDAALFGEPEIRRIFEDFLTLLESGMASSDRPLSELLAPLGKPLSESAPEPGEPDGRPAYIAARNETEARLVEIWENLLGAHPIGVQDNFFDLNGRSVLALQLFGKIKTVWGKNLPLSTLFHVPTVEGLAKLLADDRKPVWSSVVPIQVGGSKPPLYLISGLGGNVVRFHALARHLGADQPVYALQPPGLGGERPFITTLEEMAAHYIAELRKAGLRGPYHLAGYSFGGLVTHEMACQLLAQGDEPGLVALLDTPAWTYSMKQRSSLSSCERLARLVNRIHGLFAGEQKMEFLRRSLQKRVSRMAYAVSRALGRPLPQTVGTIEDVNSFAAANHRAKHYRGELTLLRSPAHSLRRGYDSQLGWGSFAESIDIYDIPGNHDDITAEPHVRTLAERLAACLKKADDAPSWGEQRDTTKALSGRMG